LSEQDSQDPQACEWQPFRPSLWQIFAVFCKIGTVAYGGGWDVIAATDANVVERLKWLDRQCMVRGIALSSVLPGAAAANMAAFVGYRLRGITGSIFAALGLLLPSSAAMMVLTLIYFKLGDLAASQSILLVVKSAAVGIILGAGWRVGRLVFRDLLGPCLALATFLVCARFGINMIIPLLLGGAFGILHYLPRLKEETK